MEKEGLFRLLVTETGHILNQIPPPLDMCSAESRCGLHVCCVWLTSLVVIRMSGLSTRLA